MEKTLDKPLSIIDALYGGFELVFRRPWIVVIPIALDLFLWMGPRVTATPIFQQFISFVNASSPPAASPEMAQSLESAKTAWLTLGNKFNLFSIAALVAIGMPTLMGVDAPSVSFLRTQPGGVAVADGATFAWLLLLMIVLGIFVGSVYLQIIARGVRGEKANRAEFVSRAIKSYIVVGALIATAFLGGLLIMLPFTLSAVFIGFVDTNIASFLFLLGMMILMWAALYLSFAVPAIFVSGANLWQAIVSSITVFRYNFWSALGLISLIYLIDIGFQIIWQALVANPWGTLGADVANAFLGSSLIAAMMLFYYDRITWLNRIREQIRQQQKMS